MKSHSLASLFLWSLLATFAGATVFLTSGCSSLGTKTSATEAMTPGQRADELFDIFDVNGDGILTRQELEGGLRYVNNEKIRNSDGTMFALTKKKPSLSTGISFKRKLKDQEIKKLVEASFSSGSSALQERLTREEFKAIVTSNKPGSELWQETI